MEELRKAEILAGADKDNLIQVLTLRADLFYRKKDFSSAFSTFDKALTMNSNDLTILNNYAYYLSEQDLRLKDAEAMSHKVVEIEKDNITFLDTYAWVLYKRGKIEEARKVMEKIFSSEEKIDATLFEHYGYILQKDKKCNKAIEYWQNAIKLDSTKTSLNKEIDNCRK
jgi:Tfp pilus assembly protein PilF